MAVETQEAWCEAGVNFVVSEPSRGVADISSNDPRLKNQKLYLNTLSSRQDLVTKTVNSCFACNGNVSKCVLKNGG